MHLHKCSICSAMLAMYGIDLYHCHPLSPLSPYPLNVVIRTVSGTEEKLQRLSGGLNSAFKDNMAIFQQLSFSTFCFSVLFLPYLTYLPYFILLRVSPCFPFLSVSIASFHLGWLSILRLWSMSERRAFSGETTKWDALSRPTFPFGNDRELHK